MSAYERGAKQVSSRTLSRLLAAIGAGRSSPVHRMQLVTAPAAGAALRAGLRGGWKTADLLRVVREMIANAVHLRTEEDWTAYFAEPSTTGDPRWDALLAGVSEKLALSHGRPVPAWTAGKALPEFWFVGSTPSLDAYAFSHSPMSLQIRGVMLDPADLEAV